ncbi:PEP/pyruvate-binding domain-containing protein [Cellulosilyticum ruminicola]|uniref:PEP/pyruvate-binding domain-containing protein n=1 Tax=Cellulosilyticum ruminicola TaxID=425254 RepID=UPI00155DA580|nr:PEP/pyruvate-binding domain-containing protein [Cellulosilyticum ruminicola]
MLGGKGNSLNQLKRQGIFVPEGYIISIDEFEKYLEYNQIECMYEYYISSNLELQERILNGCIPPHMKRKLEQTTQQMQSQGVKKFVIRSSAICEDGEIHSMAGMFESYINLDTYEAIDEAIKKVYASLFSDHVIDFMLKNEYNFELLKMAIVFQEYLPGQVSGVAFTADTVEMNEEVICISATEGECANFVGGEYASALYKINKRTQSVLCGLENHVLSPEALSQLVKVVMQIEKIKQDYQDIEWTLLNGKVCILQARSITTFKTKDFPVEYKSEIESESGWKLGEFQEPLLPFMQDIISIESDQVAKGAESTVFRLHTYVEHKIINGFSYVRTKVLEHAKEKRLAFEEYIKSFGECNKNVFDEVVLPELRKRLTQLEKYRDKALCKHEVAQYLNLAVDYLEYSWEHHWLATHGSFYVDTFYEELVSKFSQLDVENYYDLIYGESLLQKERKYLFEMAKLVKASPVLADMFKNCSSNYLLYGRLNKIKEELSEAKLLLTVIKNYLFEYGMCDAGMDAVIYPILYKAPERVIQSIREMLKLDFNVFENSILKTKQNKECLKKEIESQLTEQEVTWFREKLKVAEAAFLTNDNHNHFMERMYRSYLYLALEEAANILVQENVIKDKKDIYYLRLEEVKNLLIKSRDMKEVVHERKVIYRKQRKMYPLIQLGKEEVTEETVLRKSNETTVIQAISGLNKVITGKIVSGMQEVLEEEYILLLPHCHYEGIIKIISSIKGIIFEMGSPYDHMGIIAREMGVLAMYDAKDATTLLKDGDIVELDGINGKIRLISRMD